MAFYFDNWGSWGLGDFYDGIKTELITAIESGQPFNTGWHGWKHELESMCIQRNEDRTRVLFHMEMDSVFEEWDLIADCLKDDEMDRLTDEMVDEIRKHLMMSDYVEEITEEETLPVDATFNEIIGTAAELKGLCDDRLTESYRECIATTLWVMYGESDATHELIEQRIRELSPERWGGRE